MALLSLQPCLNIEIAPQSGRENTRVTTYDTGRQPLMQDTQDIPPPHLHKLPSEPGNRVKVSTTEANVKHYPQLAEQK